MLVQILFPHKWVTFGVLLVLLGMSLPLLMMANLLTPGFGLCFLAFVLVAAGSFVCILGNCFYLGRTALEG
jgi:hypothetical protein